jgi:hypothetical protein
MPDIPKWSQSQKSSTTAGRFDCEIVTTVTLKANRQFAETSARNLSRPT